MSVPANPASRAPHALPRTDLPDAAVHHAVLSWYAASARVLPWREPGVPPWQVLVSEVMLQQTPVARVLPAWLQWCERWPTPTALAADPPGEAVRAWDRLGYPRRALRLHAAAVAIVERHDAQVPDDITLLRALPGVGAYTAAAVASFAFRQRHAVLDTNVRRVLTRLLLGEAQPPVSPRRAEAELAESLLPADPEAAAQWGVAVMELGALVCRARTPSCPSCPLADRCAWRLAGCPPTRALRRTQSWAGTDRQARGALLRVAQVTDRPVTLAELESAWPADGEQRARALAGLVDDGLLEPAGDGRWRLPGLVPSRVAQDTA